ncbi:MAG: YbjQ family protein [Candidatus Gastranaerophilales bacterium]|nr:YbjQ family protein [Candidatus Gastranaerophilales bacterium]
MDLLIAIILLIICYFTGNTIEKNHYKVIKQREVALYKKPYITFSKKILNGKNVVGAELVSGVVVIGCDYFKSFLASLRNLFGGNVSAYESVLDRGRREALLRMREYAAQLGANIVMNVKIETVMLDPLGTSNNPKVSVMAYGTAVKYE